MSELLGMDRVPRRLDHAGLLGLVTVTVCVLGTSYWENNLSAAQFSLFAFLCLLLGACVQLSDLWINRFADERLGLISLYLVQLLLLVKTVHTELQGEDTGLIWLLPMPLIVFICMFRLPWWLTVLAVAGQFAAFLFPYWMVFGMKVARRMALHLLPLFIFMTSFAKVIARESRLRYEKEQLAGRLEEANQRLRAYAAEAEEWAVMRERNRLARDIHDSLGHYLTAVHMQAVAAAAVLTTQPEKSRAMLGQIQDMAKSGLREVRQSVAGLREDPVAGKAPGEYLTELAEVTRRQGVAVTLAVENVTEPLPPVLNQVVYRAAQESLTNVRKYAAADQVWLSLHVSADELRFVCRDNGRGAETLSGGFGLTGLRERAKMVGGEVHFATGLGEGFTVELVCPLTDGVGEGETP